MDDAHEFQVEPGGIFDRAEDALIKIADLPLCYVCRGRRVWPWRDQHGHLEPCLVCGGHGRGPY